MDPLPGWLQVVTSGLSGCCAGRVGEINMGYGLREIPEMELGSNPTFLVLPTFQWVGTGETKER